MHICCPIPCPQIGTGIAQTEFQQPSIHSRNGKSATRGACIKLGYTGSLVEQSSSLSCGTLEDRYILLKQPPKAFQP